MLDKVQEYLDLPVVMNNVTYTEQSAIETYIHIWNSLGPLTKYPVCAMNGQNVMGLEPQKVIDKLP